MLRAERGVQSGDNGSDAASQAIAVSDFVKSTSLSVFFQFNIFNQSHAGSIVRLSRGHVGSKKAVYSETGLL